jgi:hypothetical protein
VSGRGVLPDPDYIEKVINWPLPTNVTQVRGIVALGSYFRRHVQGFSKLVKPLIRLTEKNCPLEWTPKCGEAFRALKKALTGAEVMSYSREGGQFILDTDAYFQRSTSLFSLKKDRAHSLGQERSLQLFEEEARSRRVVDEESYVLEGQTEFLMVEGHKAICC